MNQGAEPRPQRARHVSAARATHRRSGDPSRAELRRLNWALAAHARSSAALVRFQSIDELFSSFCEAIVEHDAYALAWVGLAEHTPDRRIRPVASAGSALGYLENLRLSWADATPEGRGPSGRAIRDGDPLIVRDTRTDPSFAPWRVAARQFSIRSSVTVPFKRDGRVLGVIVVYASRPNAFGPRELGVFADLAETLAFATSIVEERAKLEAAEAARRAAEAAARASQAELARVARFLSLGELAASIAHEINQPLAALTASSAAALRWIENDPPNLDRARSTLRRIDEDAKRASSIIGGVRKTLARGANDWSEVDLNRTLVEAARFTERDCAEAGVSVRFDLAADLPAVRGDEVELQQVMLNLILNAIEATRADSDRPRELSLATARTPLGEAAVIVEDSGAGLDPALAERVFEPFYSTKTDGMGLGLSISRSIVERHGGGIAAAPRECGGAAFRFTLPGAPACRTTRRPGA